MKPLRSGTAVAERTFLKSALITYPQRGNVLFLILIAVALFAALSYAIVTSGRTNTTGASREKMSLALGFLDQYVEEIRVALDRIRIINHCRLDEISFENSVWKRTDGTLLFPAGYNPNHTRDDCKIFHVAGGQLSAQLKPEDLKPSDAGSGPDPYAPNVHRLQILGVGSDEPEIIIHWRVPIAACIAFNERMGIAALASDLTTGLQAHYETSGIPAIIGDEVSYIVGRSDIAYIGTGGANPVSCRISYTLAIN